MNAAEDDELGFGLRGEARELERISGEVGVLIDIGALVMVAQQHCALAKAGAGGTDALMRLGVGERVETVETDGGYLHEANPAPVRRECVH